MAPDDDDDRITCPMCACYRNGYCGNVRALPHTGGRYRPDPLQRHRCVGYLPGDSDPDRRPGRERFAWVLRHWPGV